MCHEEHNECKSGCGNSGFGLLLVLFVLLVIIFPTFGFGAAGYY